MKRLLSLSLLALFALPAAAQTGLAADKWFVSGSVSVGEGVKNYTNPDAYADPSAWFQMGKDSTNRGFLPARVVHISDIPGPWPPGLTAFVYDSSAYCYHLAGVWKKLGATGSAGAAGTPGSVWRNGTGAPAAALGSNGDYYLNGGNGDVFLKSGGTYAIVANIRGPQGLTGATGATGPPGPGTIASTTAVLKGNGLGGAVAATAGTDYGDMTKAVYDDDADDVVDFAEDALKLQGQNFAYYLALGNHTGFLSLANLAQGGAAVGNLLRWSGTTWGPWAPNFLTSEVDGDPANEGALSVEAGTATSAVIRSQPNGSAVQLNAGAGISVTDDPGTSNITWTAADISATNEVQSLTLGGTALGLTLGGGGVTLTKANVGLGLVDNTTDASKPVSTPQQTALDLKANLASPTFTGTPAAPTAAAGTNSAQIATTGFVTTADALKANIASPTFTGIPAAPTATAGTSTTQLATTAFVSGADALKANIASPTFTGTPAAPTPAAGTNTTQVATTAFVTTALAGLSSSYVPLARTLTVNGVTQDLSANRSWTVSGDNLGNHTLTTTMLAGYQKIQFKDASTGLQFFDDIDGVKLWAWNAVQLGRWANTGSSFTSYLTIYADGVYMHKPLQAAATIQLLDEVNGDNIFNYWVPNSHAQWDAYRASDGRRLPMSLQPNGGGLAVGLSTHIPQATLHSGGTFRADGNAFLMSVPVAINPTTMLTYNAGTGRVEKTAIPTPPAIPLEEGGTSEFEGDDLTASFTINLPTITTASWIAVTPGSEDAALAGAWYATNAGSSITVHFIAAPTADMRDIVFHWQARD